MINPSDVIIGLQAPGVQQVVRDSQNTMMRPPKRRYPRYVSGARGLSRALGITLEQAQAMLDSGDYAEAVRTNGPQGVTIIDLECVAKINGTICRISGEAEV